MRAFISPLNINMTPAQCMRKRGLSARISLLEIRSMTGAKYR